MKTNKSVVIKKGCHFRMSLSGIYNARRCQMEENSLLNECVEDPRLQPSGMTTNFTTARGFTARSVIPQCFNAEYSGRKGFTLIELLVVVLIIGILAAVAVPQYKLAVVKSRVATILPLLRTVAQADSVYFLSNGNYSPSIYNLDVDMPGECTALSGGATLGQLWKCGEYFLVDNSAGQRLIAKYCPEKNDEYFKCRDAADFTLKMHVTDDKLEVPECDVENDSALGQKICNSLSAIF